MSFIRKSGQAQLNSTADAQRLPNFFYAICTVFVPEVDQECEFYTRKMVMTKTCICGHDNKQRLDRCVGMCVCANTAIGSLCCMHVHS